MQPSTSFAGPPISHFRSHLSPLRTERRSRRLNLSPVCTLKNRGSIFRQSSSFSDSDVGEEALNEGLRKLRIHYNTYRSRGSPDPSTVGFLQNFAGLLKTHDANIKLPSEPSLANLSIQGEYYQQASRILSQIRQSEPSETEKVTNRLLQQQSIIGPVKRRNAFFLGIPHNYLRAHEAFHPLPTSPNVKVDYCESLTSLRQDCKPFLAAWQALPLHVNEIWPLLGFGEENSVCTLLPSTCRGHKHALRAWKRLFSPGSSRKGKRTFRERFAHERVANGALSYIIAEQLRWKSLAPAAPPWCDAVQLLETGCWVHNETRMPLAAAPTAQVVRRDESDFWMWGAVDTILIIMAEDMYGSSSGLQCRFERSEVRQELDLTSWIQAQFSMLCSGQNIRFADVVWYATLGGVSVFRVRRDDTFLQAGLEALERFVVHFVDKGCPPYAGFEQGELFQCMTERISNRCENVERLSYVSATVAETRLTPWRERMNDWETRRSQNPFFENRHWK